MLMRGRKGMPFIEVKLFDYGLTGGVAENATAALTYGLPAACGAEARDPTEVAVRGISPQAWGLGSKAITSGRIAP
jgi:phenylpyruvate tautomerase PptA (4-oxalocrotonate tautomerase family)